MENDQKSKQISQNPSRKYISLKDIPPLDPSSIPLNSSLKPRRMMMPVNVNEGEESNVKSTCSTNKSKKGSAKSVLNEICNSKHWKHPVYECCNTEGPSHMRIVEVEIRDFSSTTVLECFGDPKGTKKAAAEHAAEGAVWYLKHIKLVNQKECK